MRRIARLIFNRWVFGAIGILALALLIWWVGPMIAIQDYRPFEPEWVRWLLIALVVVIPVGRAAWRIVKARRATRALTAGLLQAPDRAEPQRDVSAEEVAQLRRRFEEALALLRKLRFGTAKPSLWARLRAVGAQPYLYDLPWYVFIGAPGAGKTTALLNSGLRFPLADRLGRDAVQGVGGTRNCDWWFTDEAVFLDTAGRYTTQQSDRDVDAGAWKGFLGLLKKSRPRRPINGVLLTVSVTDLLQQSPREAEEHAQALRARIQELYQDLGVRLPIYVLVTKADLLAGFTEFFATLGKEDRAQPWGFSLPFGDPKPAAALSAELEALERRLYERLPERLEEEREPARRALLYGFPQQFASLRDRLVHLLDAAFTPSKFEAPPLLRGVYFTSGTQEGSPIDRVMGALGRALSLERNVLPAQRPSGRSYFLTQFLRDVVFAESGLAGIDLNWERRRRWLQQGALALAASVLVIATAVWWVSYVRNRAYLHEVAGQVVEVKKQVGGTSPGAKSEVSGLLPTLTSVRTLSETRVTPDGSVPWSWRFGLYQGGKLETASRAAYQRMLQDTLLPTLAAYLERHLRQHSAGNEENLYETLKTYLMLYDPKRFNRDAVWRWYETRGEQLLAGAGPEAQKSLQAHVDALYERGWVEPAIPKDERLIAQVRGVVGSDALPTRIYERLKREPVPDIRDFTVVEKAGPKALLVFERHSQEPLTRGVPALYTKDAYYKHFMKRAELAAAQLAQEETWVLGTASGPLAGAAATPRVLETVKRLYLEEYRRIWRRFISDLTVVRNRDLAKTIEITRVLSGPDTPLKPLMKAIEREVTLSEPPGSEPGLAAKAQGYVDRAKQLLGAAPGALEKALVDDQFEDIRRFASGQAGAPPAIDGLTQLLGDFYQLLLATQVALDSGQAPPPSDAANKLRAEGGRQPEPIRSMLHGLVERGTGQITEKVRQKKAEEQRQEEAKKAAEAKKAQEEKAAELKKAQEQKLADLRRARTQIDAELRAQIADFCVKAIDGRYPFVRSSKLDVTPEDFAYLFRPGGLLDGFFQKHLSPHVDTSQKPWRFSDPAMGQSAALVEFQRAQVIRNVFFPSGGNAPSVHLELKPINMDASIHQFTLNVDGQVVRYAHGPQVPLRVQFPGPGTRREVRVSISPPPPSGSSGMRFDGPWALFRMFDEVQIQPTRHPDRFVATIPVDGRQTVFEVFASSVRNPFRLPEVNEFRCPTSL